MEISIFLINDSLYFDFSDEEVIWDYVLNGDWFRSGVWIDNGEDGSYYKDLKELKWR